MTRHKPSSCDGCPIRDHGTDFSAVSGTGSLGVMVVAEASGEYEAREQRPLVEYAPAGSVLERTFRRMGLSRQQFSLTNCIRCRPRNNWLSGAPYEFSALNHCRANLDAAIRDRRPRAILALGDTATRELTGEAGEARGVSHLAGYVLPLVRFAEGTHSGISVGVKDERQIPVIVTFHPAFIRRGKAAYQGIFARNLQRAVNVAAGKDHDWLWNINPDDRSTYGTLRYDTHPSLDDARSFVRRVEDSPNLPLSYDIETIESASLDEDARDGFSDTRIRLIQFSLGGGSGIAFPWEGDYRGAAQRLLQTANVKCGHNVWLFDNKVLEAAGLREGLDLTPRGTVFDTLAMFHHWQPDLPAHLQFAAQFVRFLFPWKHLAATNLEFYGCVDVDATLRLYTFLRDVLAKDRIWDSADGTGGYVGQVQEVRPILADMERRGLPVDDAVRRSLDVEFDAAQQELQTELDRRFPDEARSIHPKQGYKKTPKDTTGLVLHDFQIAVVGDDGEPREERVSRCCRLEPFSPNSAPQLIRYMRAKGHKVPKSREQDDEGNDKNTTAKKELIRLAHRTGDNFYLKVIECRELSKMRGTYIDGFAPHADGCVHTTFTFDTGIGQLSSRNPNVQNFVRHGRLAKATRRMIAAQSGHLLAEWDYRSCHVLTLGFLAEDPNYIRCARIDMHSIVTGHKLGLWDARRLLANESDAEIKARCKWLKSNPEWKHIRDARMKHALLGIGNGLKARGLFEKHMEDFSGQKEAQEFLAVAESLFPKVFEWQKRIQQQAHEQQFLRTQYGHIRRFYEVFRWDPKRGAWGHGDQAEEAISYWLSNIAFGYIREHLKELARLGLDEKYGLCNNVHDSLVFHLRADLLAEHIREVYPVLVAPSKVLSHPVIAPDGLWIDADLNVGPNWSDMEEIDVKSQLSKEEVPNAVQPMLPTLVGTPSPATLVSGDELADAGTAGRN